MKDESWLGKGMEADESGAWVSFCTKLEPPEQAYAFAVA
jgi:hypothetical protein